MTVPVSVQQRIRVLDAHGMSWRSIAKEVGVARDTVAKYAGREDCSPGPERSVSRPSKLDPFRATVDGWLQADRFMPRKQRHTAKRVYDRLVSEKGYEGSYSPVRRYVKRWREEHRLPSDGYLELKWHPGEAQVDFGMAQAVVGGDRVDVHCLVVTFPYSNMRYCVALPGENAECVCAGLRTVFEHIGAVPLTLVLDNATGAGHRIAWDKVTVVHVFELFVEHYRLETRFCNPNSGNEKGSVENAVGFLRRNIMVPMPDAESHGQLTRYMLERCDAMAKETHYRKGAPIGGLFAGGEGRQGRACADRRQLLPRRPLVARLDSRRGSARVRRDDPHPGRTHLCQTAARVRGFAGHGAQPRHAPARVEPQDPRMDRFHHP